MADEISDLRLFTRIAAAGGLSEAARRLHSSPPAMSRRLAALEARLGVRLIDRTSRRFVLTEEGGLLHERALRIVAEIDEAEAEASAGRLTPSGRLRVGAPMELGRQRIAPLLAQFSRLHPQVACELVLSDAGLDVVGDELDFTFRTTAPAEPGVTSLILASSRRVACAAPAYLARRPPPAIPQDLIGHDCLRLVRGRRVFDHWSFLQAGRPSDIKVSGALSSTSGEVIHGWALAGEGLAFKAHWDVADDLREGRLVECLADFACDDLHLYGAVVSREIQPSRIRALVDFMRAAFTSDARPPRSPAIGA